MGWGNLKKGLKNLDSFESQAVKRIISFNFFKHCLKDFNDFLIEFKCKVCQMKAEGVCLSCFLSRFCFQCFKKTHFGFSISKNHEFTPYVGTLHFFKKIMKNRKKKEETRQKLNCSANPQQGKRESKKGHLFAKTNRTKY